MVVLFCKQLRQLWQIFLFIREKKPYPLGLHITKYPILGSNLPLGGTEDEQRKRHLLIIFKK